MNTTKKIKKGGNKKNKTTINRNKRDTELRKLFSNPNKVKVLPDKGVKSFGNIDTQDEFDYDYEPYLSKDEDKAKTRAEAKTKADIMSLKNIYKNIIDIDEIPDVKAPHKSIDNKVNKNNNNNQTQSELNQTEIIKEKDKKNIENFCKIKLIWASQQLFLNKHDLRDNFNVNETLNEMLKNIKTVYFNEQYDFLLGLFNVIPAETYETFFTRVQEKMKINNCLDINDDIIKYDCVKMNGVIILLKKYITYDEYKKYAGFLQIPERNIEEEDESFTEALKPLEDYIEQKRNDGEKKLNGSFEKFHIPTQTEIIEERDKTNVENFCKFELVLASRFLFYDFEIDPSFYFNPDDTLDEMDNKISPNLKDIYKRIRDCFAVLSNDTYQKFFIRVNTSITDLNCRNVGVYGDNCVKMNVVISLLKEKLTFSDYLYYALHFNQNKQPPPIERDHDKEKKVLQRVLKNEETNLSEAQQVLKNGQQLNEQNSVIYSPVPKNQTIQEDNNENNTSPENDTSLKYNTSPENDTSLKYNTSEYSFVISIKNNGGTVSIFVYKVKSNKITEITEILKRRKDLFFNKYSVNKDKTGEIVQTKDNQRYKFSSRDDYTLIHDVNNNVKSFDNKNNDVEYSYVISSKDDDDETVSVFICNLSSDEIREINERDILKDLKSTKYFVQGDKKTVTVQENTVQNYGLHNNPNLSELFYEKRPIGPNGGKKRKTFKRKTKILKRKTFKKHKRHNRTTK
jgi:hypothetical protein